MMVKIRRRNLKTEIKKRSENIDAKVIYSAEKLTRFFIGSLDLGCCQSKKYSEMEGNSTISSVAKITKN